MNAVLERIGRVYARASSSRAEGKQGTGVARVISLANQKGGVAKTTSTVNLAVALSEKGRRVLIVDLDPQSNLTMSQGFDPEKVEQSMFDVLVQRMPIEQIIQHAEVDIAVASIELAGAELALASMIGRERALEKALLPVQGDYDFILVDTPPSLGLITVNALTASDGVIVPVQCEYLSLRGLVQLEHTLSAIRENLNPRVKIIGILPTMYDARSLHVREAVEILEENFGSLVFKTRIRKTIRYAEAPVKGQSVLRYEPKGLAAEAYRSLAEEVLAREQAQSQHARGAARRPLPSDRGLAGARASRRPPRARGGGARRGRSPSPRRAAAASRTARETGQGRGERGGAGSRPSSRSARRARPRRSLRACRPCPQPCARAARPRRTSPRSASSAWAAVASTRSSG